MSNLDYMKHYTPLYKIDILNYHILKSIQALVFDDVNDYVKTY